MTYTEFHSTKFIAFLFFSVTTWWYMIISFKHLKGFALKNKILEILHSIAGFPLPNKQNKPPKNLKSNVKEK